MGPLEESRERFTLGSISQIAEQIPEDRPDIRPVDQNNCPKGPAMDSNIKKQLRFFQTQKPLEKNQMSGATNGEKLRNPLNDSEDNRLEKTDGNLLDTSFQVFNDIRRLFDKSTDIHLIFVKIWTHHRAPKSTEVKTFLFVGRPQ